MTEAMTAAREVTIVRVFDAPREAVWRAWTEPEQLARWWGKRGWNTPVESIALDVRPGGVFRLNSINDADGSEMPMEAVFSEVVEPERLAFRGRSSGSVTLTDLGDGRTEMVFHATMQVSDEIRERAVGGLQSAFDRLAEVLS
jgi:uncharacterized protein YndB with AHSA1/START domain